MGLSNYSALLACGLGFFFKFGSLLVSFLQGCRTSQRDPNLENYPQWRRGLLEGFHREFEFKVVESFGLWCIHVGL